MNKFLVTGIGSGLGKYLNQNLSNSEGLYRHNFDIIKNKEYDTIIHCAFNKENKIVDYKKYLNDNIILTYNLKTQIKHNKFIYISTVNIYQNDFSIYSLFKKFSESLMEENDLILRCSMILGNTMRNNHITKLKNNVEEIGLSGESMFNYISMEDIYKFIQTGDYKKYKGILDFISNDSISLLDIKNYLNSTTKLGDYVYKIDSNYLNPIYNIDKKYNKSSWENIKQL